MRTTTRSAAVSPTRSPIASCGLIPGLERILDLATGTGWTSRQVAKRGAMVIGADIASELVAAARARAQAEGLAIEYQLGDAEALPFADGEFDAVISTCGIMFSSRQARWPPRWSGWLARPSPG